VTDFRARSARALATFSLVALVLTGCAGTPAPLQQSAAEQLQVGIVDVTNAAAAGDFEGAQTELDRVQDQLRTIAAAGQVTAERASEIQSAISLVSGDLTAAIDTAEAQAAAEAEAAASKAAAEARADAQAKAEAAAEAAKRDQDKDCKKSDKDCGD